MAAAKNILASRATVGIAMMLCVGVGVAQKAVASDTAMPVSTPGSASTSAATVSLDAPAAGEALRIYGRMGDFLAAQQTL